MNEILLAYLQRAGDWPSAPGGLAIFLDDGFEKVLMIMMLPMLVLMLAAFLAPFVQVGPIFAPEVLRPDFSKLSPFKGFGRLFSRRSLIEFLKGLAKISLVGAVAFVIVYPYFGGMDHWVGLPIPILEDEIMRVINRLLIGILVVLFVIMTTDFAYQRFEHYKKLRMTKQELKDEYKQSEGDPHVKARLRQLRNERARRRMMQSVPKADVVITNPTHFAIALEYKPETMDAPICLAKGTDSVALRIREVAKEHNISIVENPPLARTLYDVVELDEAIPPEQYKAVAEVISFVFKTKGRNKPPPSLN